MRMTEEEFKDLTDKRKNKRTDRNARLHALGRLPVGKMNKTEAAYDAYLTRRPDVVWHKFEGVKLRLADNTFYTPDFAVMLDGGELQMHEVKGFWKDDSRVKIKVAASLFPMKFIAAKLNRGVFEFEEF